MFQSASVGPISQSRVTDFHNYTFQTRSVQLKMNKPHLHLPQIETHLDEKIHRFRRTQLACFRRKMDGS